jgi:hypothetical protein
MTSVGTGVLEASRCMEIGARQIRATRHNNLGAHSIIVYTRYTLSVFIRKE